MVVGTLKFLKINSNKFFILIEAFLTICILQNMQMWPAIYFSSKSISLGVTIILFIFAIKYYNLFSRNVNKFLLFTLLLIIFDNFLLDGISSIPQILPYIVGIFLFQLHDKYKQKLLLSVSVILSIIILFGFIFFIIWLLIDIPPVGIIKAPFYYSDHYNYIFFILPIEYLFPRFSGPFIEPGHMGMISVFLIYANNFDFKSRKFLWILLIGVLFSLSLAAYILLTISIILKIRIKFRTVLISFILILGISYIITEIWDNGDNPVNNLIYSRLEYDEEKGIVGNNRTFERTDNYYDIIVKSGDILIGKGSKYMHEMFLTGQIMGAGYKMFFMQFGIIGTIIVFVYYFIIAKSCPNKYYAYSFLLIYIISFLQRAYPYWIAWLLPYICGMNALNFMKYKTKDLK